MKVLFNWDVVEIFFVWTNFSLALNLLTIFGAVAPQLRLRAAVASGRVYVSSLVF